MPKLIEPKPDDPGDGPHSYVAVGTIGPDGKVVEVAPVYIAEGGAEDTAQRAEEYRG